jgi:putative peptidoglycan lipid II flippase
VKVGLASVALSVAGLTLAGRILGFGRSLVFSKTVGDTCLGDAYNAANSLPNVLFEIVAGGVLAGVVIPVVARHAGGGRRLESSQTVSALITWTLLVLTPAGLAALAGARVYGQAFAKADCVGSAETVAALLVMFVPQIWLYGLAVVSAGVLQAHRHFLAAAAAPLLSSLVVISAYLIFAASDGPGALAALGWGTTAGVLVLALATLIPLARLRLRAAPAAEIRRRGSAGDPHHRGRRSGRPGAAAGQRAVDQLGHPADRRSGRADPVHLGQCLVPAAVRGAGRAAAADDLPRLAAAAEAGVDQVRAVLAETGPVIVALAWLGAALLVATAVPVARVFVLGPGSERTAALAAPIMAFAPAVVGFAMLGLASRTLLAQHDGRAAGLTTASAWAVVIIAVLAVRPLVRADWLVPGRGGQRVPGHGGRSRGRLAAGPAVPSRRGGAGSDPADAGRRRSSRRGGSPLRLDSPVLRRGRTGGGHAGRNRSGRRVRTDLRRGAAPHRAAVARPDLEPPSRAGCGVPAMRIAQVLTASVGGIGRHVASIAPRMQARGHDVRVFCPAATAEAQGFADLGLEVYPLARLDRARGADVLHAHGYKAGGLALPVAA